MPGTEYQNPMTGTLELTFQKTQVVRLEWEGPVDKLKANHHLRTEWKCKATPGAKKKKVS